MTGLLLEGIVAAGKSSTIRELQDSPAWRTRESKLILSEFFTERANEHLRARTEESYRTLMEKDLRILEAAHQIESASPHFAPGSHGKHDLAYILERFHVTNALSYAEGRLEAYQDIDDELARLGCRIVLVVVNEMMIEPRLSETYRYRDDRWRAYQDRLRSHVGDLTEHYSAQQQAYRELVAASAMQHVIVDATDKDWSRCARELLRFWRL